MTGSERFVVPSTGAQLMVRSYAPDHNAFPGRGVLLLHGLLSSSDIFDVPGLESLSLARRLQGEGLHVVTYDQRGTGDSTSDTRSFGLREHALLDLPAVLSACRARLGLDRVVLLGHSLGGMIWLHFLRNAHAVSAPPTQPIGGLTAPSIAAGVALACPGVLDRHEPPWVGIVKRGRPFIDDLDRDRDEVVTRGEFTAGQVILHWPLARIFFPPASLELCMRMGGRSILVAGLLRRFPVPMLIFNAEDFDDATFKEVLRSRTLDCASQQLFTELYEQIVAEPSGAGVAAPPIPLRVLCIGSAHDRLVPLRAVQAFGRQFDEAPVLATEDAFGSSSGHAGYLFKARLRDRVFEEVLTFVTAALR